MIFNIVPSDLGPPLNVDFDIDSYAIHDIDYTTGQICT